jgi:C6 transcription factor Pro1
VANPHGVVTNAICSLASIHHILMLKSIGQEAEDPEAATSLPRRFYEQANEQIMASKAQNGAYTAQDATAALQLVSFSLFVGGVRGWENALQIAGDWYEKTGVVGSDNPLRAMWELNLTAKFASRLTVWFDIFSCELLALFFFWFPLIRPFPYLPRSHFSSNLAITEFLVSRRLET